MINIETGNRGPSQVKTKISHREPSQVNRNGDRQLNRALHNIVLSRLRYDERTRAYVDRRTREGRTRREIIRCLKRYVARDLYRLLEQSA